MTTDDPTSDPSPDTVVLFDQLRSPQEEAAISAALDVGDWAEVRRLLGLTDDVYEAIRRGDDLEDDHREIPDHEVDDVSDEHASGWDR